MKKIIAVEKLSKKEKKKLAAKRRVSWNDVSPVTRVVPSKKQYNRKKSVWKKDTDALCQTDFLFCKIIYAFCCKYASIAASTCFTS